MKTKSALLAALGTLALAVAVANGWGQDWPDDYTPNRTSASANGWGADWPGASTTPQAWGEDYPDGETAENVQHADAIPQGDGVWL
ncbi:hypothetical protein [Streptomyces sp. NPDC059874]|uniref:hypothetical protein n=1 Tax=Streptomyces sp. NPDC059874 TaxID=3346983 RepID=UPI0036503625